MSMPERRNSGFRSAPNPLFARNKSPNSARKSTKKKEKLEENVNIVDGVEEIIAEIAAGASVNSPTAGKCGSSPSSFSLPPPRDVDVSFVTETRSGVNYTIMYVDDDDQDGDDDADDNNDGEQTQVDTTAVAATDAAAVCDKPEAVTTTTTTAVRDAPSSAEKNKNTNDDNNNIIKSSPVASPQQSPSPYLKTGAAIDISPTVTQSPRIVQTAAATTATTTTTLPAALNTPSILVPPVHIERPRTKEINPYDDEEPEDLFPPDDDDEDVYEDYYRHTHEDQINLEFEHTDADEDQAREERYKRAESDNAAHIETTPFDGIPKLAITRGRGHATAATAGTAGTAGGGSGIPSPRQAIATAAASPHTIGTGTAPGTAPGTARGAGGADTDRSSRRKLTPDDIRESRASALIALASYKSRTVQNIVNDFQIAIGDDDTVNTHKFEEILVYMPSFISGDLEVIEKLVEAGPHICDQIVQITRLHQSQPMICERACKVISLLATQADGRRQLIEADAGGMVCTVLMLHGSIISVAEWGLRVLRNLSINNNATALLKIGAIDTVLSTMKSHKGVSSVTQEACSAIAHFASSKEMRDELAISGACDEVAEALVTHDHDPQVVDRACMAVMYLTVDHEENCKLMGELGACDAIVGAFKQHKGDSRVAECAAAAVHNLASYGPNRRIMLLCGVQKRLNYVLANIDYEPVARQEAEAAFLHIQSLEFEDEFGPGDDCKCDYFCVIS